MLHQSGTDLWFADGGIVSFFGADYPTRMVIVRLADGGLWLWSPVALSPQLATEVRLLGPVRHLVSPNKLHHLFLREWHLAFPKALLWGTASTVAKCTDVEFSRTLADQPPPEWAGQIEQFYFTNSPFLDELMFFHRASRTAIIADLSQAFSEDFLTKHWSWWLRKVAHLSRMTEDWGYPPIDLRFSFRRRSNARLKVKALLEMKPERVVMAHGEIVRTNGTAFLRRAFSWLM